MGKRGRIPQQKDKLVGHRDNSLSVIQGGKAFETPKHNTRWLTKTKHYLEWIDLQFNIQGQGIL